MTHDEMIAVIQAHKEGKTIQQRSYGAAVWLDATHPKFNFSNTDYRVKPEPKVIYVNEYGEHTEMWAVHPSAIIAHEQASGDCDRKAVKYIEVIE